MVESVLVFVLLTALNIGASQVFIGWFDGHQQSSMEGATPPRSGTVSIEQSPSGEERR